jgi:hypothetical protein
MCFYCIEGDTPFHLRKSSAFPRKTMVTEVVDAPQGSDRQIAAFRCDASETAEPPSAWPKRKSKATQ